MIAESWQVVEHETTDLFKRAPKNLYRVLNYE